MKEADGTTHLEGSRSSGGGRESSGLDDMIGRPNRPGMNEDNWELGLGGTGIELEMSHGIGQNDCRAEQARNE